MTPYAFRRSHRAAAGHQYKIWFIATEGESLREGFPEVGGIKTCSVKVVRGSLCYCSPWVFSMKITLESELKFCPVRIICWPPRTEQPSISCFSTRGSSWAERWAEAEKERDTAEEEIRDSLWPCHDFED